MQNGFLRFLNEKVHEGRRIWKFLGKGQRRVVEELADQQRCLVRPCRGVAVKTGRKIRRKGLGKGSISTATERMFAKGTSNSMKKTRSSRVLTPSLGGG